MPEISSASDFAVPETYIDEKEALDAFLADLIETTDFSACAIDTEADSMHSYETKLCLIQFATRDRLFIIDPLSIGIENLGGFTDFVDRFDIVWMHGADYDISMFNMTFDWVPACIYDTQFAARFLGKEKFGLANLLEDEYDIRLSKQSQKADWSRRPLTDKMLEYAYNDVRYLLDLGGKYVSRLQELGRMDWFIESCEVARSAVLSRSGRSEDDIWRISGWGRLSPKGLNFLKHLWHWRDDECRRLNRPAFKFVGNGQLIEMAEVLENDGEIVPPKHLRPAQLRRLQKTVSEAKKVEKDDYPRKRRRGNGPRLEIDEDRFNEIRAFRNHVADELGIEGTVIATRQAMERLASGNLSEEERTELFQKWQAELLKPVMGVESVL
ncbi:MAG: hypothetical protein CMO55_06305 [Verrucomicrobiales bacterium]|nr:hypothetical protein [Verrucomicrobiales bacterium]